MLGACGGGGGGGGDATPIVPPSSPPPPSVPPTDTPGSQVTATFTIMVTGIEVERSSNGQSVFITINNVWNDNLQFAE